MTGLNSSRRLGAAALAAMVLMVMPAMTSAQDEKEDNPNAEAEAETARLNAETARIKAETERINARTARSQARISALGLPSFEGTATANAGAGAIEAAMLSTVALRRAATLISGDLGTTGTYLVLSDDEALDFAQVGAILTRMDALNELFKLIPPDENGMTVRSEAEAGDPALIMGAISAAAGLLRSDVEITALETEAISSEMLVTAIAGHLRERAILPSALIGVVSRCPRTLPEPAPDASGNASAPLPAPPSGSCLPESPGNWEDMYLIHRFNDLTIRRQRAGTARRDIPEENQTPAQRDRAVALDRAISAFDSFYSDVTTADDEGSVPIGQAGRLDLLRHAQPQVLRVHVAQAGGSLVKSTNLLTTLGADPLRVSGAIIVRYSVTDPARGTVSRTGILTCQTALTSIRRVQQWTWTNANGRRVADCQEQ